MKFEIYLYHTDKMPSFYKKAIAEYDKRLSRYGKISFHMIKKEKEWTKLLDEATEGYYVLPGKSESSEALCEKIGQWERESRRSVSFFINANHDDDWNRKCIESFSISDFTINGPMVAMVLFEQIYRGYRIMHNHPYHK